MKYIGSDYVPKGELKGFPLEVIDKMLERQAEQESKLSVKQFEESNMSGFIWSNSSEGQDFWEDLIDCKKFDLFFEKYPKGFYKGDYVVLLGESYDKDIPSNYVYKLLKDGQKSFFVELDLKGPTTNGFIVQKKIRHATTEEILNYQKENKPVKATMETEKKIIGYNLKKGFDESMIARALDTHTGSVKNGCWLPNRGKIFDNAMKLCVLDLWFEPVYEEDEKTFELSCDGGTFELAVSKKGLYYAPDNKYLDAAILRSFLISKESNLRHQSYTFQIPITHIHMGCKKNVPISHLWECLSYYFNL